ncbi:MAG: HU family DNA-binding protein [Clostridia bacterium]|nr:HU family DNA-binding protein [Clostridia bacterium]
MNKTQIIDVVRKAGFSKNEAETAVNTFIGAVIDSVKAGEKVQIFGFGSFDVKERPARVCNNPKTGKKIKVPARKVVVFRPAAPLKKAAE